jgi:hypothetical protein
VRVKSLDKGGLAQKKGVFVNDVLRGFNGMLLSDALDDPTNVEELTKLIKSVGPNEPVILNINGFPSAAKSGVGGNDWTGSPPTRARTFSGSRNTDDSDRKEEPESLTKTMSNKLTDFQNALSPGINHGIYQVGKDCTLPMLN